MAAKNDGGPAFPSVMPLSDSQEGLTKRDYFAAAALPVAMQWVRELDGDDARKLGSNSEIIAGVSYEIADAMLAEREKEPTK